MRTFRTSLAGPATKTGSYSFRVDDDEIRLEFFSSEFADCPLEPGFIEGLWRFDCGELFLFQPETSRYLEINIAPNGAWWSCVFSDVRCRDGGVEPPIIQVMTSDSEEGNWRIGFRLSRREIARCIGSADNLLGNVTLILGGCPETDVPLGNLHSVATLGAVDFHRPHEWVPLEQLET